MSLQSGLADYQDIKSYLKHYATEKNRWDIGEVIFTGLQCKETKGHVCTYDV